MIQAFWMRPGALDPAFGHARQVTTLAEAERTVVSVSVTDLSDHQVMVAQGPTAAK